MGSKAAESHRVPCAWRGRRWTLVPGTPPPPPGGNGSPERTRAPGSGEPRGHGVGSLPRERRGLGGELARQGEIARRALPGPGGAAGRGGWRLSLPGVLCGTG